MEGVLHEPLEKVWETKEKLLRPKDKERKSLIGFFLDLFVGWSICFNWCVVGHLQPRMVCACVYQGPLSSPSMSCFNRVCPRPPPSPPKAQPNWLLPRVDGWVSFVFSYSPCPSCDAPLFGVKDFTRFGLVFGLFAVGVVSWNRLVSFSKLDNDLV